MRKKILLIGAGTHCKVILEAILQNKEYSVYGIIDVKNRVGDNVLGFPVVGTDLDLPSLFYSGVKNCFITAGSVGSPMLRIRLYNAAKRIGFSFPNIISPRCLISPSAVLGRGNYIAPGVIINAGASIGDNCILNTGAVIEHDCTIGNFVHIAPGSTLSGSVKVGDSVHVGAGSVLIQNIRIGKGAIIGIGSVVTDNIGKNRIAYGNPCREIKANA